MTPKNGESNTGTGDTQELCREWFWHEGQNLATRTDFFLIFHAILFEAYLSASANHPARATRGLEIGTFGIVSSLVWLLVGARNDWNIKYASAAMKSAGVAGASVANLVREWLDARDKQPSWIRWAHSVSLFSRIIPFACLDTWLVMVLQDWVPIRLTIKIAAGVTGLGIWLFWRWPGRMPSDLVGELELALKPKGDVP